MEPSDANAGLEIYLLRHAHAGDAATWSGPDSERPLSAKGRRQAQNLGQFLADRGFATDAILSSPKVRARQTAELVADALGVGVSLDDRLAGALDLDILGDLLDGAGGTSVVFVGHDPDFTELAMELTGAAYLPLKKGALARIDTSLPLQPGTGILRWLLPPELVVDRP